MMNAAVLSCSLANVATGEQTGDGHGLLHRGNDSEILSLTIRHRATVAFLLQCQSQCQYCSEIQEFPFDKWKIY